MNKGVYRAGSDRFAPKSARKRIVLGLLITVLVAGGFFAYKALTPSPVEKAVSKLQFEPNVSESEKQIIKNAIESQSKTYDGDLNVSVQTVSETPDANKILSAYVPVTQQYASRQGVTNEELRQLNIYVLPETDDITKNALAEVIGIDVSKLNDLSGGLETVKDSEVAFVPVDSVSSEVKLLALNDAYYLDSFQKGALYRVAAFTGNDATSVSDLELNELPSKETVMKVNMTGVTALTRVLQRKLASVRDPLYFSEKIGDFLADADITHISNEVSFRAGCQYSNTLFCSPPEFIETLKDSGVDLVELTGNHNNDNGSTYNTDSINLYHSVGMATFGGGLNTEDAAKPHVAELKGNKVTFLGYNMADGAGSGAIAGSTTAGANFYTEAKAKSDIEAAKQSSQFVVVNIQYAECQAYPAGYVEFPECDGVIGGQEAAFRKMIDLGADMVVGSSAHQPQTYEFYKGKAIYYGLGNMYFDQTQWPGTERGIILTNYLFKGKLLQTKLTPTVYDRDFQTRILDPETTDYLLRRLNTARP